MGGGWRWTIGVGLACAIGAAGTERVVADEGACRDQWCSGHGVCMTEREEPFCLCEDAYAADGLSCVRAEMPSDLEVRRRSPTAGGRIVYVAAAEAERGPAFVGASLTSDPGPLSRYLRPHEMWCSDFVSWVYRVAGVPFTGGYDGGWRLTNNFAIRRWFQRRGLWIDRSSAAWRSFTPAAGDYIRMHTASGNGHSAIVRYAVGDTLYTVEGNVGNRVRLRRYVRFRDQPRIDGFGFVTMPEARRALLERAARATTSSL